RGAPREGPAAASWVRGLRGGRRPGTAGDGPPPKAPRGIQASYDRPAPSPGVNPIGAIQVPGRATVEGRVRAVEIRPVERSSVLPGEIPDPPGALPALFYRPAPLPRPTSRPPGPLPCPAR